METVPKYEDDTFEGSKEKRTWDDDRGRVIESVVIIFWLCFARVNQSCVWVTVAY